MAIRQGTKDDFAAIFQLYRAAGSYLLSQGFSNWEHYPNEANVSADLETGTLYLLEQDQQPVAVVVIDEKMPFEYEELDWVGEASSMLLVHRLATHPDHMRKGYGRQVMDFVNRFARQSGYQSIRLDANADNLGVLAWYEGLGYERRGEVLLQRKQLRVVCFEFGL